MNKNCFLQVQNTVQYQAGGGNGNIGLNNGINHQEDPRSRHSSAGSDQGGGGGGLGGHMLQAPR